MRTAARGKTMIVTYAAGLAKRPDLFARTGFGVEISDYAFGKTLDRPDLPALHATIRAALAEVPGTVAVHGPYRDMNPASPDERIRAICRERYLRAFELSADLRAAHLVLHTGYDPNFRSPGYDAAFVERSAELFTELFTRFPDGPALALENMFDPDPGPLAALLPLLGGRAFALLDTGHLNVFSRVPPAAWAERLAGRIGCLHLNDNDGALDRHDAIGRGSFDFKSFFDALSDAPALAVEVKNFDEVRSSLEALGALHAIDLAGVRLDAL